MGTSSVFTTRSTTSARALICVATAALGLAAFGGATEVAAEDRELAVLELGYSPADGDPTLRVITSRLDELNAVCVGNSRLQLADAAEGAVRELSASGLRATPTRVLNGAVAASGVFGPYPVDDCRPMFAMLVRHYVRMSRYPIA